MVSPVTLGHTYTVHGHTCTVHGYIYVRTLYIVDGYMYSVVVVDKLTINEKAYKYISFSFLA